MQDNFQYFSLTQLNGIVSETLRMAMPDELWVEAELAGISDSHGHCYMELVEKDDRTNTPVAQARACCWRGTWMRLKPRFERETGQSLQRGMKVLLRVKANFHVAYGFSWIVTDLDPTFTLGDLARRRQEILRILKEEGVIDLNKQLPISPFAKRIAVISSATAAGYGDFCNQLAENAYGFAFETRLFPAIMQGEQVESSIIDALNAIDEVDTSTPGGAFDVVVIIRGGGSTTDLTGFDTLPLAEHVANFPLPIITGIGHERDTSILDMIACVSVKTPTAVAAFLIDNLTATLSFLEDASQRIANAVKSRMEMEHLRMARLEQSLASVFAVRKVRETSRLDNIEQRLPTILSTRLEREHHRLEMLTQRITSLDPINILRRGYSIVTKDGKAIKDATKLKPGDKVEITFAKGKTMANISDSI